MWCFEEGPEPGKNVRSKTRPGVKIPREESPDSSLDVMCCVSTCLDHRSGAVYVNPPCVRRKEHAQYRHENLIPPGSAFMTSFRFFKAFLAALLLHTLAPGAARADILARWTQYTATGAVEARAITGGEAEECPALLLDGRAVAMREHAEPNPAFPVRVCAAELPASARTAMLGGKPLALAPTALRRIVIIGDTGCRIKSTRVQPCNDPAQWPFERIAMAAAREKPDLVIHAGDYHYRESPCPGGHEGCKGSPSGDTWAAWNADFFAPAQSLLAAAPMIAVRGNHEECARAGGGWSRFLASGAPGCAAHEPAYALNIGGLGFFVMDVAEAPDAYVDETRAALYRRELAALAARTHEGPVWLLIHKPVWSFVRTVLWKTIGESRTLAAATDGHLPAALRLAVSGHVHSFQAIAFEGAEPPQLVVGNSGTAPDKPGPSDLAGITVGTQRIARGLRDNGFGYFVFERDGEGADNWQGRLVAPDGKIKARCSLKGQVFDCRPGGA